jgi:pilus assembly protein CpaF
MDNIIIGWDMSKVGDRADLFKTGLAQVFTQASGRQGGYETDAEHIYFVSTKERVDVLIGQGLCDILVCSESLGSDSIGVGALKQWRRIGNLKKVILVVSDQRYGKGKLKGLYDNEFYDALFEKNFFGIDIVSLTLKGRTKKEAYDYYGLKDYKDPMATDDTIPDPAAEVSVQEQGEPKAVKKSSKTPEKNKNTVKAEVAAEKDEASDKMEPVAAEETPKKNKKSEDILNPPTLESEAQVIERQHELETALYIDSGEIDFSKGVTAFLKKGIDIEAYLEAMSETATAETRTDRQLNTVERVEEEILHYYTQEEAAMMGNLERGYVDREQWDHELMERIEQYTTLTVDEQKGIFNDFNRFMFGYDKIEQYIMDPAVTDIKMLAFDAVQTKRFGKRVPQPNVFRSPEHFAAFVEHLAKRNHVNLQKKGAVTFMDTRSYKEARLRVNIATERVNLSGVPSMEIRKQNNVKYTTKELVDAGMMTNETAAYLIYKVRHDNGIVICGGNAQGKTSLTNWMLDYIPRDMTGLCLQEEDELFSKTHPFLKFQKIIKEDDDLADESESYDLKKLMAKGLKTDNDYFIISEITGEEAKFFVNASFTGSRCLTTVHSMDTKAALPKIADYAMYDTKYTKKDFMRMLKGIKLVVYIEDFQIKEISEVGEWIEDKGDYEYREVDIVIPKKPKRKKAKDAADAPKSA